MLFLKYWGLVMLIYLNVILLRFFCYFILLSEGIDEFLEKMFVLDLKYIFEFDVMVILGKFIN